MAITSKEINLGQLDRELGSKGLICNFNDPNKKIISPADNSDVTEAQLETAIAAHVAQPPTQLSVEDKLASVGLSINDLKAALGV